MKDKIKELIKIYESEVKYHKKSMKTWKGVNVMLYATAEQKKISYERVLEDLNELINNK